MELRRIPNARVSPRINIYHMILKGWLEVTQKIFLFSCYEYVKDFRKFAVDRTVNFFVFKMRAYFLQ